MIGYLSDWRTMNLHIALKVYLIGVSIAPTIMLGMIIVENAMSARGCGVVGSFFLLMQVTWWSVVPYMKAEQSQALLSSLFVI
jgi:hypothetical protein